MPVGDLGKSRCLVFLTNQFHLDFEQTNHDKEICSLLSWWQVSGHPAIAPNLDKFFGIRNGIDQEIWDPLFDKALPRRAMLLALPNTRKHL